METAQKLNCWEYMKCGREPSGDLADRFGVCPAATDQRLDGIHGGTKAGRACWIVAGAPLSGKKTHCVFAKVYKDCDHCDFYQLVRDEEKEAFRDANDLSQMLHSP